MGLRGLIETGSVRSSGTPIFTNRVAQAEALAASRRVVRNLAGEPGLVMDLSRPRNNILSFYGRSGIGKSALSRHLDELVLSGEGSNSHAPITYRHDFAKSGDRDFETLLIAIRARLAVKRIPAEAFDLAFSLYWSMAHPGLPLSQYLQGTSAVQTASGAVDLASVMTDALSDLTEAAFGAATFGVGSGAARLTTHAIRAIARSSSQKRLLRDCPYLEEALDEEDLIELLAFLPHFLAWDLNKQQAKQMQLNQGLTEYIIFFDTWEDVQSEAGHYGSLEDLLCRLMFLMPNCLFVVTGRERLRWADESSSGQFIRSGPQNWPGLVSTKDEPRQHMLDRLTDDDSLRFLEAASPAERRLPANVLTTIVSKSDGYPAYLNCAVDLWNIRRQQGTQLSDEDLAGGFPQLFTRTMRGLSQVEQNLLQAAALLPAFSIPLLEYLVPQALPTELRKFIERHFVEEDDSSWLNLRISSGVRHLVVSNLEKSMQWTPSQKRSVLTKAANWVGENVGLNQGDLHGRARVFQGVRFFEDVSVLGAAIPPTAVRLIFAANSAGYGRQLGIDGDRSVEREGFAALVHSICSMEGDPGFASRAGRAESGETAWMNDLARVAEGRRLLLAGDIRGCLDLLAIQQVSDEPETRRRRRKLEVLAGLRGGKLEAARRDLEEPELDWCPKDEQADLLGHLWFWNGNFMRARMSFALGVEQSRRQERQLELARGLRHLARVEEVMGTSNRESSLAEAKELNIILGSPIGTAQVESIEALVAARAGRSEQAHSLLSSSLARLRARNAVHDVHELCVIAVLVCHRLAEQEQIAAWAEILQGTPSGPESKRLSAAILGFIEPSQSLRLGTGVEGCEFSSTTEARNAWRQVAGLS